MSFQKNAIALLLTLFSLSGFAQYYDGESGYAQNHHRDYDSSTGRYLQADKLDILSRANDPELSVAEEMGLIRLPNHNQPNHLYGYAAQNPVMHTDRMGLELDGTWGEAPPYFPNRNEHANRNRNNKCPQRQPPEGCDKDNWDQDPDWMGGKHRNADGSECRYDSNGNLTSDNGDNYTYNYGSDPWTPQHVWQDVLPNIPYGKPNSGQTPPAYNP